MVEQKGSREGREGCEGKLAREDALPTKGICPSFAFIAVFAR